MSHVSQKGFTIIELMLAMTFTALLLMAVAMTTIQISDMYNKGITLKEVNQAGRSISDDITRTIAQSEPFDIASPTSRYIVKSGGGRLCTGRSTYVWNIGKALRGGPGAPSIYNVYVDSPDAIRLVKVNDPGGNLCDNPDQGIVKNASDELLSGGDRDLVVHVFTVSKGVEDTIIKQALYLISITIGTNDGEQLTTTDTSCKSPSDGAGNEDYCSVNQFDITARAGNKVQTGN